MDETPEALFGADLAAAADRHAMDVLGMPSAVLMERASLCVAHEVHGLLAGQALPVWVLVGPGNNGGDGLAVARILGGWGHHSVAVLTTAKRNAAADEQLALARAAGVVVVEALTQPPPVCAVVVDGMLGTGARGSPRGEIVEALRWQTPIDGPRVAIDVPSGVDVDTGDVGPDVFVADLTVTFARSKPGLHVTPGRDAAGAVVVADIGIVPPPQARPHEHLISPRSVADALAQLPLGAHKGQRGHVAVLGGGANTPGAAILAATAAMRGGAGLSTIVSSSPLVRRELIEWRPELMVAAPGPGTVVPRANALVVGPGLTDPDAVSALSDLYRQDPRPALWDASALDHVPFESPAGPRIVTPHPGEAARLLSRAQPDQRWDSARIQADRLGAARTLAELTHASVVLKGAGTVVAEPTGDAYVAVAGSEALATAGSGDVLAGLGGGLLARGLAAPWAARVAVHVHGVAGELAAARRPLPLAADIVEALSLSLQRCVHDASSVPRWPRLRRG